MFERVNETGWNIGDKLTPLQINTLDINVSRAVDGIGGGTYPLLAKLSFAGTGGVELAGTGPAQWLLLSSRTIVRPQRLEIANVLYNVGTNGQQASALLIADSTGLPVVATPSATTPAQASYHWLALTPPCNGAQLNSVTIQTQGYAVGPSIGLPIYLLGKWARSTGPISLSFAVLDGHASDGSDWLSPISTTITAQPLTIVDTALFQYILGVNNPYGPGGAGMYVLSLSASWTLTSFQPV